MIMIYNTDGVGQLHVINGQLDVTSFQAYDNRVSLMYQLKQHNVLVTVGVSNFLLLLLVIHFLPC